MSRVMVTMPNYGMLGKYWNVMLFAACKAFVRDFHHITYQAPLSWRPVYVRAEVRTRGIRIRVWERDADDFTADFGHLDRMSIPYTQTFWG